LSVFIIVEIYFEYSLSWRRHGCRR